MTITILMTGATGFLGSNILKQIQNKYSVIITKRSFSKIYRIENYLKNIKTYDLDVCSLDEIFKSNKIDIILHCATDYGRKSCDPLQIIDANLILPLKLLELGKKHQISSFINTDTILDKGINSYSLSKNQFKEWLKSYSTYMTCVNVALEHFYGPGDDESKFVSFIIRNLIDNKEKIDLSLGDQKRDFIFIDDVVEAFIQIIENSINNHPNYINYEIGTKNLVSIRYLVELIKKLTENEITKLNFGAIPYRDNEIMESNVNLNEIKKLGWKVNTPLIDGLKRTIIYEKSRKNKD